MALVPVQPFAHAGDLRSWESGCRELELADPADAANAAGVYCVNRDGWWAVLRVEGILTIARPGEERMFSDLKVVEIGRPKGKASNLKLHFLDGVTWEGFYTPYTLQFAEDDFTPFMDEEDFDFGKYLRGLKQDVGRQDRVFRRMN